MSIDNEILKDFIAESKSLIKESADILNKVEGDLSQAKKLDQYGNLVDRIMGGAKSLAVSLPPNHILHTISDYAALCKAVGYKTSQISDNRQFYDICVALLLDATETLEIIICNTDQGPEELKKTLPHTFIERLRWVSNKFNEEYRESVGINKHDQKNLDQPEIDDLLKKLGI